MAQTVRMRRIFGAFVTAVLPMLVNAYAPTDSIQDADAAQSGYLPNHNMDPNVVGGSSFGILWQQANADAREIWYAKPLTYTLSGGSEMVITASNKNMVRINDAKNGTLINSRQLCPPFLQSDIGCADIPDYIGVTGTPIIDPATDIIYMMAKGYKNGAASGGVANGIYQLYALQLPSLTDVTGFPVMIDGRNADNDPTKYFIGGTVLQRPSLTTLNGVIVAAFGGHCDLFNYTGYLAAISKSPGVGVVSLFAMEASPGSPKPQPLDITVQNGGKAGIWQSGMGLATDGNRLFVCTGNGQGHANGNVPASGKLPMSTLDEVVANFGVSSAGKLSLSDYFEPYDYVNMDAGDRDLGSGGTCLLDQTTFKTSTINRIAVTVGKNSKIYIMDANNLGGFKQGTGGTDNILQSITVSNSVFGGAGSYPLEGGYFYVTPVGDYTYAYKFGTDSAGAPFFVQAGKTPTLSTGRAGVGQPTVTTNGGKAGTGILWITDVNTGLGAYRAVPDSNGVLQAITLPATPGINKYQRPAFGNGRVFVTSANKLICLGAPVNLPLNCTSPVDFGNVQTGSIGSATVSCKANIAITKVVGCNTVDKLFQCDNSTLPTGAVAAGTTFTVPLTWNLTQKAINDVQNVSYGKVIPGIEGTVLNLFTTNGVAGYSTTVPVSLTGTVVSSSPFLHLSPSEVDFGGIVLGTTEAANGLSGSAVIQNIGASDMTITGYAWQNGSAPSAPYNNLTFTGSQATFGLFSSSQFLPVGTTVPAGKSVAVPLFFNSSFPGAFSLILSVWSDGGLDTILLTASAGNPPVASIAVSTNEGGWDNSVPVQVAFGNVLAGSTVTKKIRICNEGGSVLTITKSKPPVSPVLTATNPYGDLLEGQKIDVATCAYGTIAVYAPPLQPNHPSQTYNLDWVLNTDGLDALNKAQAFGVRDVITTATVVSRQVGPLWANGTGRYQWVGCFQDSTRNLPNQVNNAAQSSNNTNEQCQSLCLAAGYALAGTEYQKECWCGNAIKIPSSYTADSLNLCTFACTGDGTESCGGNGGYLSLYADTSKFNIQAFYKSLSSSSSSTSTTTTSKTSSTSSTTTTTSSTATTTASSTQSSTGSTSQTSSSSTTTVSTTSSSTSTSATTTSSGSPLNPNEPAVVSGQWNYIGCYMDNVNGLRTLPSGIIAADTMTLEACASNCASYNFFGTEYGRECYCGYTLDKTLRATESDCNALCKGNTAQICGTGSRLSVYNNTVYTKPPAAPQHVAQSGSYSWMGCYGESTAGRALASASYTSDLMTVDSCASFCGAKSYKFMGVEYGRECYCGNVYGGTGQVTTSSCNMLCKNNNLQYCGTGGKLDMYTLNLTASSTSTSTSSTTATSSKSTTTTSSSSVTTTPSTTASSSTSTTTSSSTSITTTSSSSPISTISSTTSVPVTTTTTITSVSTTAQPGSTSTTATATPTAGYYPIGCFQDTSNMHALPLLVANNSMTPELCLAVANSIYSAAPTPTARLPYVYIEYHGECYGGSTFNFLGSAVTSLVGTNACNDYCWGSVKTYTTNGVATTTTDLTNRCGGAKQFNLYALSTNVAFPTTGGPVVTSRVP